MKNQSFAKRHAFALAGLCAALKSEASFRTQAWLAAAAALVLFVVRPPLLWVALCILSAAGVFAAELMNTALEHLADRLHPDQHPSIRLAKDCAAAAVWVMSAAALVVGALTVAVALNLLKP
jgi:diacylglycerol kinase (ATP)